MRTPEGDHPDCQIALKIFDFVCEYALKASDMRAYRRLEFIFAPIFHSTHCQEYKKETVFQVTTPTNLPVHFIIELQLQSRRKLAPRFFMPTVD